MKDKEIKEENNLGFKVGDKVDYNGEKGTIKKLGFADEDTLVKFDNGKEQKVDIKKIKYINESILILKESVKVGDSILEKGQKLKVINRLNESFSIKMGNFGVAGSSLQGFFPKGTKYQDLVKVFGEPQIQHEDSKVKVEWIGYINNKLFIIYDYKSNSNYRLNTEWHIGGIENVTDLVLDYFNQHI